MKRRVIITLIACFSLQSRLVAQKLPRIDYLVNLETKYGKMKLILFYETPLHRANFMKLAKDGFYDSLTFHRVIKNFMIQGGDPFTHPNKNSTAKDFNGATRIPAEFVPELFHKKGALAAARDSNPQKASSPSQFYIVQGKQWSEVELQSQLKRSGRQATDHQISTYKTLGGTPHLDGNYTVFGEVVTGLAILDSVAAQITGPGDRPKQDIYMKVSLEKVKMRKLNKKYGYKYPIITKKNQ